MKKVHKAKIENSTFHFHDPEAVKWHLKQLKGNKDTQDIEVTIRKPKSKRSLNQNAYYWGVVLKTISQETGHTPRELHELFKAMYLAQKIKFGDREYMSSKSTTQLTTEEFADFVERIRDFAARELNIYVPESGEYDPDDFFQIV